MTNDTNSDNALLATPVRVGPFRICPKCQAWFAMKVVAAVPDAQLGSLMTYQCKKCGKKTTFAASHPADAI